MSGTVTMSGTDYTRSELPGESTCAWEGGGQSCRAVTVERGSPAHAEIVEGGLRPAHADTFCLPVPVYAHAAHPEHHLRCAHTTSWAPHSA
eukprot:2759504-Rhodomonas_salina.4